MCRSGPLRALALLTLAVALMPRAVHAQNCRWSSASDVSFGTYDVFATTPLDSAGTIVWRCNSNTTVRISLTRGASTTFTPRTLISGSQVLAYNLYLDAARTGIWGDGTQGTLVYTATGSGTPTMVPIYGRIPAGQDVPAGSYADTVTAIINF